MGDIKNDKTTTMGPLGMMAAQGAVNVGMGMLQNRQSQKQAEAQKQAQLVLMRQSQQFGKEMWDYTNYENQMKHMKNAGLNPALMYGMGGGGGVTTGGQPGGSAAMANTAQFQGVNIMDIQQQAANVELMKSQANLNNVEARNKDVGGVIYEGQRLANLNTGETFKLIQSQAKSNESQAALNNMIARGKELENKWKTETWETSKELMWLDLEKSEQELKAMTMKNEITEETMETEIQTKKLNYIIMGVQKRAMEAGIKLTEAQTEQVRTSIAQRTRELDIMAKNANTNEGQLKLAEFINDFSKGQEAALDATKFGIGIVADIVGNFLGINERNMTKVKRLITRDKAGNVTGSTTTHEGRMKPPKK